MAQARESGKRPCGRVVRGDLILDPVPLPLANRGGHPHCYGMPPDIKPIRSVLASQFRRIAQSVGLSRSKALRCCFCATQP
jgi:hypothetical protein